MRPEEVIGYTLYYAVMGVALLLMLLFLSAVLMIFI